MLCSSLHDGIGIAQACNAQHSTAPSPAHAPHAALQDKQQAIARLTRVADQGYVFAQELLRQWQG